MDKSNLIVNYLQTNVNEDDLNRLFSDFGRIQSLKIVRDKGTGISMGFGFVNFDSNEGATKAAETLNGLELHGKRIKVSVARPAWKANIHSNLYIANLPTGFSESDVLDMVGPELAAHIEHVRMLKTTDSMAAAPNTTAAVANPPQTPADMFRGVAVARFDTEESANAGLEFLNSVTVVSPINPVIKSQVHAKPWRPEFRPERAAGTSNSSTGLPPPTSTSSRPSAGPPPRYPYHRPSLDDMVPPMDQSVGYSRPPRLSPPPPPTKHSGFNMIDPGYMYPRMWMQRPTIPMTETEECILQSTFEQLGAFPGTLQMYPDHTWGYVKFPNNQAAYAAVNSLTGFSVSGKILELEAAPGVPF